LGIAQHQTDVPGYGLASFLMGNAHPTGLQTPFFQGRHQGQGQGSLAATGMGAGNDKSLQGFPVHGTKIGLRFMVQVMLQ
jgi:hypothetical protein